jgi:hypothetical protein
VASERDGGPVTRHWLVGTIESPLDGVALEGDVTTRSSLHEKSFARPPSSTSGSVWLGALRGR